MMTKNFENLTTTPEFTALFNAHETAALTFHDASQANMERTDKAQWEALQTAMGEAYTALMDFLNAHTQSTTPADVEDLYHPASLLNDDAFDKLFNAAQTAAHAANEADREGWEQSDPAEWRRRDEVMLTTYHAFLDYINERIADARASTQTAIPAPELPALESITKNESYTAALDAYTKAVEDFSRLTHIKLGTPEQVLEDAAGVASWSCSVVIHATIDAHCAQQVYKALLAVTPISIEKDAQDAPAAPDTSPVQGTLPELAAMLTWGQESNTNVVILAPDPDDNADTAFYQLQEGDAPGQYALMQVRRDQDTPEGH